jgi:uncharacterized protein YdaU (DUF1376 family)
MSFAYLALYTGDYLRDTRHLSCSEHGIYLLLLMHCWDSRGPVPLDERKQCGICGARSGDEVEALRRVLTEFFVQMDDGWYNTRMQREVERSQAISAARSDAGFKGYQAKAKQLPSKRQATATTPPPPLTPPPSPPLSPVGGTGSGSHSSKTKNKAQAPFFELPDWIPKEHWDAWIEARTKARKPITDYAKRLAVRKLDNYRDRGHAPAQVLMKSAMNGWADLFEPKE